MVHRDFFGHAISRLGIGTVQFGMAYGINNRTGRTPEEDIEAVFRACVDRGVTFLDTARAYGSSEESIARAIDRLGARGSFFISTKLDLPGTWEAMTESEVIRAAWESLEGSLAALRVDSIDLYLMHTERYLRFPCLWEFMRELLDTKKIRHAGISVEVGPAGAEACLDLPGLSALQIPYNVFDHRWAGAGFFRKARERGILVINRSSYLQGLLLMEPEALPANLGYAAPLIRQLEAIAADCGVDRKTLCLQYAFSQPDIGTSILGVDTAAQFEENYAIYLRGPLDPAIVSRVATAFGAVPEHCLNPALWKHPWAEVQP